MRLLLLISGVLALIAWEARSREAPVLPRDTLPAELSVETIPLGLGARPAAECALTPERVKLGRKLFFDPILSADKTISCATCHRPERGFTSGEARPLGIRGQRLLRRPPTLLNRAYGTAFFWDGRETSLEAQALRPIEDPAEMGSKLPEVLQRLTRDPAYPALFADAFGDGVTAANLGKALAAFERVLLRGDSAVDRFRAQGAHGALTPAQRHGLWLYESKARCWRCHSGPNFSDEQFHNTGVAWGKKPPDLGRYSITRQEADRGKFKTPTLRGVILTGPYMHDGSLATLDDVVDFYNRGGEANPQRDPIMGALGLDATEKQSLVEFLKAL
jgi:cytochrome c peroxidase